MKCCLVTLYVNGFELANLSAVKRAAKDHWPFGGWTNRGHLRAFGRSALDSNVNEEEFVKRLSSSIWRANGGFCFITINISREYTFGDTNRS